MNPLAHPIELKAPILQHIFALSATAVRIKQASDPLKHFLTTPLPPPVPRRCFCPVAPWGLVCPQPEERGLWGGRGDNGCPQPSCSPAGSPTPAALNGALPQLSHVMNNRSHRSSYWSCQGSLTLVICVSWSYFSKSTGRDPWPVSPVAGWEPPTNLLTGRQRGCELLKCSCLSAATREDGPLCPPLLEMCFTASATPSVSPS